MNFIVDTVDYIHISSQASACVICSRQCVTRVDFSPCTQFSL
jgi:hypothetical protein